MLQPVERTNIKDMVVERPEPFTRSGIDEDDFRLLHKELHEAAITDPEDFLGICLVANYMKLVVPEKFQYFELPAVPWQQVNKKLDELIDEKYDIFNVDMVPKYLVALRTLYGKETNNLDDSHIEKVREKIKGLNKTGAKVRHLIWSFAAHFVRPSEFPRKPVSKEATELILSQLGEEDREVRCDAGGDLTLIFLYYKGILGEPYVEDMEPEWVKDTVVERRKADEERPGIINSSFFVFAAGVILLKAGYVSINGNTIQLDRTSVRNLAIVNYEEWDSDPHQLPETRKF